MSDLILRATGKVAELRFVVADLTETVASIVERHGARAELAELIGDSCVASAFMSSMLKFPGALSYEARFEGEVPVIIAESTPMGLLRAKVSPDAVAAVGEKSPKIKPGMLRVRKLNEQGKQIQESFVEMASLRQGRSLTAYLLQSEQTKSAAGILTVTDPADRGRVVFCAGYFVEAFPKADDKTLFIMEQVLRDLPNLDTFKSAEGGCDLRAMLDAVAGPVDYEIHREINPLAFCPCSHERILSGLAALAKDDLLDFAAAGENLEIHCDFCRSRYEVTPENLNELIRNHP
jgi:molecular chaperone Hsp33